MIGGDTGGESARAKNVVVAFAGEKLQLQLRVQRRPKETTVTPGIGGGKAIPLERPEEATGPWSVCDVNLESMNMVRRMSEPV